MTERACWALLMVIAARGEGVNVCLCPPPPRRIARRSPKMRVKTTLDGVLGHAHTCHARLRPPPHAKTVKKTEILRRTFSFSYTRVRQCSPIGYMIGKTIDILNIINIGFFFSHEDICIADL